MVPARGLSKAPCCAPPGAATVEAAARVLLTGTREPATGAATDAAAGVPAAAAAAPDVAPGAAAVGFDTAAPRAWVVDARFFGLVDARVARVALPARLTTDDVEEGAAAAAA